LEIKECDLAKGNWLSGCTDFIEALVGIIVALAVVAL
jgi:hypothetical protein